MTLRKRFFLFNLATALVAVILAGFAGYYEFTEQHILLSATKMRAIENPAWEALEIVIFSGVITLLFVVIGNVFLLRYSLKPITQLTEILEATNVENLAEEVPWPTEGDELARMTKVFNEMKKSLASHFTQSKEFTLYASHELKTPLAIIHGTLEQMMDDEVSAAHRDQLASILEETQRLTTIVDQLAFLSKVDMGILRPRQEILAVHEILLDMMDDVQHLAAAKQIETTLLEPAKIYVLGDRMRVKQLLLILIDNALKYNHAQGQIMISLGKENGRALLRMSNTGPLVEEGIRQRLFERFFRGDVSHNSVIEGSGLGLCIAQSIVNAMHGEITFGVCEQGWNQITIALPLHEAP